MTQNDSTSQNFTRFAWGLLAYNIVVILWGAWVRITGSGAGCGDHWPLCNGVVVPQAENVKTFIEFSHRVSSMLSGVGAIVLLVWAFRIFPQQHAVRKGAIWGFVFIIIEGLVGALLVRKGWVVQDESLGRALFMPIHMANTLILCATIVYTALASSGLKFKLALHPSSILIALALIGTVFMGMTGAVAALGNTLNPVSSLAEGVSRAFNPRYYLDQLKFLHPTFTVGMSIYLLFLARYFSHHIPETAPYANRLQIIIVLQIIAGFSNLALHAPAWLQIVHLFLACVLWVTVLLLGYTVLSNSKFATKVSMA